MSGTLPPAIQADALFDVPPEDEEAVALEAARLEALLGDSIVPDATPAQSNTTARSSGAVPSLENTAPEGVAAETWAARQELDQARLEFYRLPQAQRAALLTSHRQLEAAGEQSNALNAAQQRVQLAEAEQQRVLEQTKLAQSEAARLIGEEKARLLGVAAQLATAQAALARARGDLTNHAEHTLALHREVREVIGTQSTTSTTADALHQELRGWLRASRDELANALTAPRPVQIPVRSNETEQLASLAVQVDRAEVDRLFAETVATARLLDAQSAEFWQSRARQLYEEVQSLNDDRLALLPYLTDERRAAITGFSLAGLDQALAETRQLMLVLRYHLNSVSTWIGDREWRAWSGQSAATATSVLLKIAIVLVLFWWGRRFGRTLLVDWQERLRENSRRARTMEVSRLDGVIALSLEVFAPLSWLLLVLGILWVLPSSVTRLLEVDLVATMLRWSLAGWLVVVTLDSLAMRRSSRMWNRSRISTDAIRLRSLRLLGIAVVVIGLILSLIRRIVGEGTIYSWVFSTCWWAALPIGLQIVHWWRDAIFERIGFTRRKGEFATWVLANRTGWRSLFAAVMAGVYLFSKGVQSVLTAWLMSFDATRRLLAYLFRQKLDRMTEHKQSAALRHLPDAAFASLSPRTASVELMHCDDDPSVAELVSHIDRSGGGVFAVVGERGSGRSTVLHRVADAREDVVLVDCPFDGLAALTAALAQAMNLPTSSDLETIAATLDTQQRNTAIIVDNAHRLIHPVMGGLTEFDRLVQTARQHSIHCAWVCSMDRIVWRFYGLARTPSLLFDEIVRLEDWSEEDISDLLQSRSRQAGIEPAFDKLVPDLHVETDEFERREILQQAARSYYRLIWDYASGNPGVALHAWRTSLGADEDGRVFVTPFRVPDSTTFDTLPDSAVFVLRAVLQLERARAEDVSRATRVPLMDVENALRYGMKCGYIERVADRHTIVWNWYRPITRFLQRRHLLTNELQ